MKLIGRYDSPLVRRVGVTLHVLEQAFEHLPLSPFSQASELRKYAAIGRMPALILNDGEVLIESAAILDHLDEIAGPHRALIPCDGAQRRKALQILACATAACDKAIAINYERRRPAGLVYENWINRSREQLDAALGELESIHLALPDHRPLRQVDITVGCTIAYVKRVEPTALNGELYPSLEALSAACEARPAFIACPQ